MRWCFKVLRLCFWFCLPIFFCTCGIENVVYLKPPKRLHDYSNLDDISRQYCQFSTADAANQKEAGDFFQGTEIYYRIYEQEQDCIGDKTSIDNYNDSNPSNAVQYLIDTKKYQLMQLIGNNEGNRPLLQKLANDAIIRFRLQAYGTNDPASLTVNGVNRGIPRRSTDISNNKISFDSAVISSSDSDVYKAHSSNSGDYWCVNFYAASYGTDKTLRLIYSAAEPLGYIKIEKKP